ncbi:ribosomal RNA small subunit methyltransferase A [Mariprofundus erugo]|uniref:Ribosomal RNA small subunit methyltransferase A n=1 Tax=Mariprofundus erugo TaxID=2528639 RepID=A0A5R9GWZ2_9PROT|nr:16S rRNA (adenine(1518)-N(6)/adenine(1519)-N(6))-dimethyltransferase RsmA [Mariprofundus erugo]TLS68557.1 ribosomal RNA small subunit methyltransferase A [Mariprofundus erugo]TLS76920.1 ribosomal RNA small subunit methyltransferase A [Mariprofundus erugo]
MDEFQTGESLRAKKALGQHFLRDQQAIRRIAGAVAEGSRVIEIGPGPGAITEALLARVGELTVIEMDDRFAAHWQQRAVTRPGLQVMHGDVMKLLFAAVEQAAPQWIAGNLPYNLSGPLTAMLASVPLDGGMVLMYQREVAERICAEPGSKVYGGLSVLARHHYEVKRLLTLPPGAFSPPPKVHSAVIVLLPHHRIPPCDYAQLQKAVRQGFAHRRKTIANNFRGEISAEQFEAVGIDPRHRPEQLDYHAWVKITGLLSALPPA